MPVQEITNSGSEYQTQEPSPEKQSRYFSFLKKPAAQATVAVLLLAATVLIFVAGYHDLKLQKLIDHRLKVGPFSDTFNVYSAPRIVTLGDRATAEELAYRLRQSGYTASSGNATGWYRLRPGAIEIFPGRSAFYGTESAVLEVSGGRITRILSLSDHTTRQSFALEPELITNLSSQREKRRLVRFKDVPQTLIHAVISVEDKHFFTHSGVDIFRVGKAAYVDLKTGRKEQGASTLTMQLARGFWLDPAKNWKRKVDEMLISMELERKLTKEQIFEYYSNSVYLGRRGTFSINGFGEGARSFLGKDLSQLTVDEAALLAGLVQRPSYYNPVRYPERAQERRNIVLALMVQNGYLTNAEYQKAIHTPVRIAPDMPDGVDSQYFVDVMNDEVPSRLGEQDKQLRSIYTTLDPDLQRYAQDAVRIGMEFVDQQLRKKKKKTEQPPANEPQVALVALDPRTGEVKALVGGRDYHSSQLNHALAMRQPGSVFKPFVYATALETAIAGGEQIFTTSSVLNDEPTTFAFGRQIYQPSNFRHEFMGDVTLRTALAHSLNVATVQLAQEVGYQKIVSLARRAGLNEDIKATPAVALGAYEATPLEMAGAYTMFANRGMRVTPTTISMIRAADGTTLYRAQPDPRPSLDPRVNYLMVSMMQDVLRYGTGAGVRGRGFTQPAAGKTGTSRDGWFAGFTSELVCVVWVGFDDNRELNLEGARSALPVWAEFMKRAAQMPAYRDAKPFQAPAGIVSAAICPETGLRAGDLCPERKTEFYVSGTEPVAYCDLHTSMAQGAADRMQTEQQMVRPIGQN
jgi:penicillin-binding protein 1B